MAEQKEKKEMDKMAKGGERRGSWKKRIINREKNKIGKGRERKGS